MSSVADSVRGLQRAALGLLRDRAFTFTAVLSLAVALGLNVTAFAVMRTMLFRGFPLVQDNERLLYIQERNPLGTCCLMYPDYLEWRAQATSFKDLAFVAGDGAVTVSDAVGGRGVDVVSAAISANGFRLLGVQPALGRDFAPDDAVPGAPRVAILGDGFWRSRFGGGADVVGSTVTINGEPTTVIGVMPAGFAFPSRGDLWRPFVPTPALAERKPAGFMAFGRLAPGVTPAQARADLTAINARLALEFPATNRDVVPSVNTYAQIFIGPDAPVIYGSVWVAAWFVLLMACANLANLTFARTLSRSRELATRLALGAGTARLGRELFTESALVAGAGGVLGGALAAWGVGVWAVATESRYQVLDYGLDDGTFAYLAAVVLSALLLFGLVPLTGLRRLDIRGALHGSARSVTQGRSGKRASAALVTVQMMLAIVLLGGTGVLVRSFINVVDADVGVREPENVLLGSVSMPRAALPELAQRAAFFEALRAEVAAVPGVVAASIASSRPVNVVARRRYEIEGHEAEPSVTQGVATLSAAGEYFRAVGAATLAGREFDRTDTVRSLPTAVVNAAFAAEAFPGEEPLGRRIRLYDRDGPGDWRVIVGVVANVMQSEPTRQRFAPLVYVPFAQEPDSGAWFFARTAAPSAAVTAAVRTAVQGFDPDLVLEEYETLAASFRFIAARMDLAHVELGKYASVAPLFAGIALLLAAVGLYAVVAHAVSVRTKEIGVRVAVGAARHDIVRLVLRRELVPVVMGVIAGFAASLAVNRVLQSQLVGVSPYDPATLAVTVSVLVMVALLACMIPARRALRVDPVAALRND